MILLEVCQKTVHEPEGSSLVLGVCFPLGVNRLKMATKGILPTYSILRLPPCSLKHAQI